MKKTGLLAILTAGIMLVTSGCGTAKGKTAIEVGSVKVTMNDVSLFLSEGDNFDDSKKQYVELMEETFKYGELGKAMGIELTDEQKDNITTSKASFAQGCGGLASCKDYLKKAGSSMEFLEELFTASAYQTNVTEKLEEELEGTEPTEEELKEYFLENYYRAKHILINLEEDEEEEDAEEPEVDEELTDDETAEEDVEAEPTEEPVLTEDEEGRTGKELADALLEKAKAGEDFDELIKKYNQDPGMEGNEDGYIFTEGDMVDEFYECVKSLEPGEFGICESTYGYHVIERLSLSEEDAKFNEWLEDNKSAVESAYDDKQLEDLLDKYCEEYNITSTVNQDAVDAFKENMLVAKPEA